MFRRDVRYLVAQDIGELRLGFDQAEQPLGDVHDSTRCRVGVDAIGVEDDELPIQGGTRAGLRENRSNKGYVGRDGLVLFDTEMLAQLEADLSPILRSSASDMLIASNLSFASFAFEAESMILPNCALRGHRGHRRGNEQCQEGRALHVVFSSGSRAVMGRSLRESPRVWFCL